MTIKLSFGETSFSLPRIAFTEAVLENEEALDVIFEAMCYDQDIRASDVTRCALAVDIWEVVMPLVAEAHQEAHPENWEASVGEKWVESFLPKQAPLKQVPGRRFLEAVDYEGPPKVKLALELLWHWCCHNVCRPDERRELFTALCDLLRDALLQRFL